ncbi:MAG: dUTP diphosphatase [Clostridia bacterium]|nr:dUTP diphosphatase [Clostridia bacterium]
MERTRGFEIAKGYEDKKINIPVRKTAHSAGYDVEAAEDIVIPKFTPGCKPTLIPTGLKAYCQPDECYLLLNRSSGPKKGFLMANSVGLIDSDYYGNEDNDGHFFFAYFNCSDHDIEVKKGDVIGQVVFTKYLMVDNDNATGIRRGGFGSTNI